MKKRLIFILLTLAAIAVLTVFGPIERTLGANLKLVLLHGAWVWTGKLAFGAAALAGLAAILWRRGWLERLTWALGWVGLAFWLTYLPLSLLVMKLNWGGIAWDEPRWRIPFAFGVAGLLLQIAFALFNVLRLTALGNVLFGIALWAALGGAENFLHPDSPVFGGGSVGIQVFFGLLLLFCLLLAGQLTSWLQKRV